MLCPGKAALVESDRNKFERERIANGFCPGEGARYRSPAAYQRLLKRRGLTDDVSLKELQRLTVDTSKRERVRESMIRRYTEQMTPVWQQRAAQPRRG